MAIAKDCLVKTVGRLDPVDFLGSFPHSSAPYLNLHSDPGGRDSSDDVISWATKSYGKSFQSSYPLPICPPANISKKALNGIDPCLELVEEKQQWEQFKTNLLQKCDESMISDRLNKKGSHEGLNVHYNVGLLAHHIQIDPDPDFNSKYNWYYTGGNVETILYGGKRFLVRPDNCFQDRLLFSELDLENISFKNNEYSYNYGGASEVFQIDVNKNFILLRQRKKCSLLLINENEEDLKIDRSCIASGCDPFISCAINKNKDNEFCTLSNEREITIWNISQTGELSTEGLICEGANLTESWGQVYYVDQNTVVYVDRFTVYLLDLRSHMYGRGMRKWEINKLTEVCEEIYGAVQGPSGLQYVSTSHHVLGLDIRKGWIQRWTHGISQSPYLMKSSSKPQTKEDAIVIGSQRTDSLVYIENKMKDNSTFFSGSHPFSVHSICESGHRARVEGLCLSHLLNARFGMSQTGLCCFGSEEATNVIRTTSIGDVFWQKITDLNSEGNTDSMSPMEKTILNNWEVECIKLNENSVKKDSYRNKMTGCVESKHLFENLDMNDGILTSSEDIPKDKCKPTGTWEKSKEQLLNYCDVLAPKILEVWNLSDDEEWCDRELSLDEDLPSSDEENDITERVSKWIETYCNEMVQNEEYPNEVENSLPDESKTDFLPNSTAVQDDTSRVAEFFPDTSEISRIHSVSNQENVSTLVEGSPNPKDPVKPTRSPCTPATVKHNLRKSFISGF